MLAKIGKVYIRENTPCLRKCTQIINLSSLKMIPIIMTYLLNFLTALMIIPMKIQIMELPGGRAEELGMSLNSEKK